MGFVVSHISFRNKILFDILTNLNFCVNFYLPMHCTAIAKSTK